MTRRQLRVGGEPPARPKGAITRCNLTFYQWFIMRRNSSRLMNKERTLVVHLGKPSFPTSRTTLVLHSPIY